MADPAYVDYHDGEWGVPSHDDAHLFEMLVLEGAQAGLAWSTILHKRAGYLEAFAGFDMDAVARFGPGDVERLMGNPAIVRNRLKINSAVANARAAVAVREAHGSLAAFVWELVPGAPIVNRWASTADIPAQTGESVALSNALRRHGFRFIGPTVCYSFMQAVGMVDDHVVGCFRHAANTA